MSGNNNNDMAGTVRLDLDVTIPRMTDQHRDLVDRHIRTAVTAAARMKEEETAAYLREVAEMGVRAMLALAGEDPVRPGLAGTPARVVNAFLEMCGRPGDPADLLARTFPDIAPDGEVIAVGPIPFTSICEHHLLPFTGSAWIGYLPGTKIVGLSKLPRLVAHYAARPQVQERLTSQIAAAMVDHLDPEGVGVRVAAVHSCMCLRGVRAAGAEMVTTALRGDLGREPHRGEFLALTERT